MAKTKRELIIATFIISCAATVLSIVSMATEEWVRADIKANVLGLEKGEVNYGLFGGKLVQYYLGSSKRENNIAIACIFAENICGFSAATQGDKRTAELENILNEISCKNDASSSKNSRISNVLSTESPTILDTHASFEILDENIDSRHVYHHKEPKRTNRENNDIESYELGDDDIDIELLGVEKTDTMRYTKAKRGLKQLIKDDREGTTTSASVTTTKNPDFNDLIPKCDPNFLNGGIWIVTICFLSFSIMLSAMTATLSVINAAGNPISPWLNIWGLYIWNGMSSAFIVLTMIFWGAEFGAFITYNAGVTVTLNGQYKNDSIALGFSFWMLFAPFCLHIANIAIFYYRQHLIDQEPEISEEKIDAADRDGMIFVY